VEAEANSLQFFEDALRRVKFDKSDIGKLSVNKLILQKWEIDNLNAGPVFYAPIQKM